MKVFHNFQFYLVGIAVVGYIVGHFTYQGIKSLVLLKEEFYWRSDDGSYEYTTETASKRDDFNIPVIKMDLQTKNQNSSFWLFPNPNNGHRLSGSTAFKNKTNRVWVVTPTYRRGDQIALLSRLAQALYPVRHFVHWLIIDEHKKGSDLNIKHIDKHLKTFSIPYTLKRSSPRSGETALKNVKGVDARNDALQFFRNDPSAQNDDVVYFADDDNGYDSEIFYQMRYTEEISMWPTGVLTPKTGLSSPIARNGIIVGFFDGWVVNRKFPVDFAMFAISVAVIRNNPDVNFRYISGYIETTFLQNLYFAGDYSLSDNYSIAVPLADNCTKVLTWHTKNNNKKKHFKPTAAFDIVLGRYKDLKNLDSLYRTYYLPLQK